MEKQTYRTECLSFVEDNPFLGQASKTLSTATGYTRDRIRAYVLRHTRARLS